MSSALSRKAARAPVAKVTHRIANMTLLTTSSTHLHRIRLTQASRSRTVRVKAAMEANYLPGNPRPAYLNGSLAGEKRCAMVDSAL